MKRCSPIGNCQSRSTRLVRAHFSRSVQSNGSLRLAGRKYRDEPRPRSGLLRTKEFYMKDLYTFDADVEAATASYDEVRQAYARILDRVLGDAHGRWISVSSRPRSTGSRAERRKWRQAEADTGSIGGRLSHEYHLPDQRESLAAWYA